MKKPGIADISSEVPALLESLLKRTVDGVTSVAREGDDWRVTVDVLDRKSIPDTQDILSMYEVRLDGDMGVKSYRRIGVRRRGDSIIEEEPA